MLRTAVLIFGVALLLGGAVSALYGDPAFTLWLFIAGGTITAGTLFERVLYKPLSGERPGPGWTATGERFIDPETGKAVDVYYDAASGERRYVARDRGP